MQQQSITKAMHVLKWLICLTAGIMGAWTGHCEASEAWKGQVTVTLNVRQAPQGNSPVITRLDQGAVVAVTDENKGWYKVVVEKETYGFTGWVYGKYVKRVEKMQETSHAGPTSADTRPMQGTATATVKSPLSPAVDQKETLHEQIDPPLLVNKMENAPGAPTQDTPAGPGASPQNNQNADQPPIETTLPGAQIKADQGPTQDDSQQTDPDCASSENASSSHVEQSESIQRQDALSPSAMELDTPTTGHTDIAWVLPAAPSMEPQRNRAGHPQPESAWRVAMDITVKIVTVAFSCLALVFAYRAWQIARQNRD